MLNDLHSPDLWTQLCAASTLIHERAVEALIDLASDPNAPNQARWRSTTLLGWLADVQAVAPLIALIADPSWEVRNSAVWSLGMIGAAEAFEPLCSVFQTSKDEQVPYIAALMLIRIDPVRARDVLSAALNHAEESVQRIAHSALATL